MKGLTVFFSSPDFPLLLSFAAVLISCICSYFPTVFSWTSPLWVINLYSFDMKHSTPLLWEHWPSVMRNWRWADVSYRIFWTSIIPASPTKRSNFLLTLFRSSSLFLSSALHWEWENLSSLLLRGLPFDFHLRSSSTNKQFFFSSSCDRWIYMILLSFSSISTFLSPSNLFSS